MEVYMSFREKEGLVFGHGISTGGKYQRTYRDENNKKKNTVEYELWRGFLRRCYSEEFLAKWETYRGCGASDNFKIFQWFAEWCNNQIGFGLPLRHLDKDLLGDKNCKLYSEDNSIFVPRSLNMLLCKSEKNRGVNPIGVHYCNTKKVFVAQCNNGQGIQEFLGYFNDPETAFYAYENRKEEIIKYLAHKHKEELDPRAFVALMNYEVNRDD